nr:zinc finger, CCHC-type [Tanacetum cinerariifolium]
MASIKKGMLEPVKVKCIFLVYYKNMVGNKLWRLDDVTSKVVLYRNMGFNESEEYKKNFIGSSVGTGSMQVLHGFEFKVKPLGDHTFEVEPQENVDQGAGLQEVQTQDLIYYHLARDREQHLAYELFGYREDINEAAFAVVVAKIWATKGLLDKAKGNVLGMEVVKNQSGYTLRVSQSSQEYQMVCTRPGIASTDVGMLDGFDRRLQTYVPVFVDFDYAMVRSITIMGRSITRYEFMILGCAGSLKANLQHMEALSTTEAGYMTFTEA